VLLVAEGGAPRSATVSTRDPFEALDDLMTLVETLCPKWPPREACGPMNNMRL
jgi:hypothetical protein